MRRDALHLSIVERELPGGFVFSTDPERIDRERVFRFLARSYWANNRPAETMERSLRGSLVAGIYAPESGEQTAFARVVTDTATFAYLCDVFVDPDARGAGLGKALVENLVAHPELADVRRFLLATRDAHGLYAKFGFEPLPRPELWMQRFRPDPEIVSPTPAEAARR